MAALNFTLSASALTELVDAVCFTQNYQTNVMVDGVSVANPETKSAFARRKVIEHFKFLITSYRKDQARIAADLATSTTPSDIT